MTAPLPALMDVLDRADALTRDELLASAQGLGTSHTPAVLAAAVDAHLAQLPAPLPPTAPYCFQWGRPKTLQAHQARLRRWRAFHWLFDNDDSATMASWVMMAGVFLAATIGGFITPHFPAAGALAGFFITLIATAILGTTYGGFGQKQQALKTPLPRPPEAYLVNPEARAYLQAVLTGGCPTILVGDVTQLERLMEKGEIVMAKKSEELTVQHQLADLRRAFSGDPA